MHRLASTTCFVLLAIGLALGTDEAKAGPTMLEGNWTATKAEREGKAAKDVVGHQLSISGGRFEIKSGEGTLLYAGTFRLHPDTAPPAIDFEHDHGKLRGETWKGIYALEAETLRVCDNAPNLEKGRPAAFEAKKGSGYVLITFKRAER